MDSEQIRSRIETSIPGARAAVRDYTGGGDHFEVQVISEAFEGKPLVQRHKMVYAALGADVDGSTIHALALRTLTPEQAASQSKS